MTYEKIKYLNNSNKVNFYNSVMHNSKKDIFGYSCDRLSNTLYTLSNETESINIKSINDLAYFFISDYNYITNVNLLKNNQLNICITRGLASLILTYIRKFEGITKLHYERVKDLDIIKGKLSILGGIVFLNYHDSLVGAVYNNVVYIYTDNICSISVLVKCLFDDLNIENNFNKMHVCIDN